MTPPPTDRSQVIYTPHQNITPLIRYHSPEPVAHDLEPMVLDLESAVQNPGPIVHDLTSPVSAQERTTINTPSSQESEKYNPTSPEFCPSSPNEERLTAFTMAAINCTSGHFEYLVDSGASKCGVNSIQTLSHTSKCDMTIIPAFGPQIKAKEKGNINDSNLGKLQLEAIHIDSMHNNLLSVHQICLGGLSNIQQIGVFTSEGCRFFDRDTNADVLKTLHQRVSTFQAPTKEGVYLYTSTQGPSSN